MISEFLTTLGLTLATNKAQPPALHVTWFGINIDLEANRLSIPQQKLDKIKDSLAEKIKTKNSLTEGLAVGCRSNQPPGQGG